MAKSNAKILPLTGDTRPRFNRLGDSLVNKAGSSLLSGLAVMLLAAGTLMAASDLSGTRFSDFRLRGGQEREGEKKLQWELKGKEAVLADGLIEITELQLELTGPDQEPTEVRSPECQFDRATNIGESPAPLQAVSQSMTLEGKGYHFLLDRQVIHLYNDVRMVIKSGEKSLFPLASN